MLQEICVQNPLSFLKRLKQCTVKPDLRFSMCGESKSKSNGKVLDPSYARCETCEWQ